MASATLSPLAGDVVATDSVNSTASQGWNVRKSSLAIVTDRPLSGDEPDHRYYPVGTLADGTLLMHGEPDAPLLPGTVDGFDGSVEWTWDDFAAARPDLAAIATPHEWAGEPTAAGLNTALFPILASTLPE